MSIDYDHSANPHTLDGPMAAMPRLFPKEMPASILDVGCGIGTWIRAASEKGVADCCGVDGVDIPASRLLFRADRFYCHDFTRPWDLGRRFEVVLCLEVGEHLDAAYAETLIDTLVKHSDSVVFSAACPGQGGQHHVNCQWPAYWQKIFNTRGYACSDAVRWRMWDVDAIEPWYKQNTFIARRAPAEAGLEPKIHAAVHPQMLEFMKIGYANEAIRRVENGGMSPAWYIKVPFQAALAKIHRSTGSMK